MHTTTKKISFISIIAVMLVMCQSAALAMHHTAVARTKSSAKSVAVHAGQNIGAISASVVKAMNVICVYVESCKQQKKANPDSMATNTRLFHAMNRISQNLLGMFKAAKIRLDVETWQRAGEKLNEIVLMQALSDLRNGLAALYYSKEGLHPYNKSMISELVVLCQVNIKKLIASKENFSACSAAHLNAR